MTQSEVGSLAKHQSVVIIAGQNPLFLNKAYQSDIYQDLISKKVGNNFIANYANKREELGFTSPLMNDEVQEVVEEQKLSDYQKNKAKKNNEANNKSVFGQLEQQAELTEKDLAEMNKKAPEKGEKVLPDDNLDDVGQSLDNFMKKGNEIGKVEVGDVMDRLMK